MRKQQWITSQIGAREHYAVPRSLHAIGVLDTLFTDIWSSIGRSLLQRGPSQARAVAARWHQDVPNNKVRSFGKHFLVDDLRNRFVANDRNPFERYIDIGQRFATKVAKELALRKLSPAEHIFFGYNTGCLETITELNRRGIASVVDQIDPARTEYELVRQEAERWPGWASHPVSIPDSYFERLQNEWSAASAVVVNSMWSKNALVSQGVPGEKIYVLPLAYETPASDAAPRADRKNGSPLRVLWVGSVILRKGIPYLLKAAESLIQEPIHFTIAGPIGISEEAVKAAPKNVEFVGRVTRDRAATFFRNADVFVLPTVSDGFAITQLEAMAHGLPVITTPNCGEVVDDGQDGFIVSARDPDAIASKLRTLAANRERLHFMSGNALQKSAAFSLARLTENLQLLGDNLLASRT